MTDPFGVRPSERILYLKEGENGKPASSINAQELYNWARKTESSPGFMSYPEIFDRGGFWGLQPVVLLANGYKIEIPDVPEFWVFGIILSRRSGQRPFLKINPSTIVRESPKARPHDKLFLSHSSDDNSTASALNDILSKTYETFIDLEDLRLGEGIRKVGSSKPGGRTLKELVESKYLILLESPGSMISGYVRGEWEWWLENKSKGTLIPVMIQNVTLPPKLETLLIRSASK